MREAPPPQKMRSSARSRRSPFMSVLNVLSPRVASSMERKHSATWNALSAETFTTQIREYGGIENIDFRAFINKEIATLAEVFHVSQADAKKVKLLFQNLNGLNLFEPPCLATLAQYPRFAYMAERQFPGIKVHIEIVKELAHLLVEGRRTGTPRHSWHALEVRFFRERLTRTGLDKLNFETVSKADDQLIAEALYVPRSVARWVRKNVFSKLEEEFLGQSVSRKVPYLVEATPHDLDALDYRMKNTGQEGILFSLEVVRMLMKRMMQSSPERRPFHWNEFEIGVFKDLLRRYTPFTIPLVYLTGAGERVIAEALPGVDIATARQFWKLAWVFRENNQNEFNLANLPISTEKKIEHMADTEGLDLHGTLASFKKKVEEIQQPQLRLIQGDSNQHKIRA